MSTFSIDIHWEEGWDSIKFKQNILLNRLTSLLGDEREATKENVGSKKHEILGKYGRRREMASFIRHNCSRSQYGTSCKYYENS
uniref:Uncharacterized protein n=1 Tax=Onchocerca volvulus TaxID=6282 RepID=A0A2K6WDJ7_ONCVO